MMQNIDKFAARQTRPILTNTRSSRSSHQRCSLRKGVLINFAVFTGKHLCQSLFFNEITGLSPATLLKKRLWHRCFPVNFAKFLRTLFFTEHLWATAQNRCSKKSRKIHGKAPVLQSLF